MRIVSIFLIMFALANAKIPSTLATVTGVASDDVLNIRVRPNYKSRKVGALSPHARVKISRCEQIGRSRWCRISSMDRSGNTGWVNARFLHLDTRYKRTSTRKLSLSYPSYLNAKKNPNGSITIYKNIPLRHISGSDMRDNPPLLYTYNLFNLTVATYPTLKQAIKAYFPSYTTKQLQADMHYDPRTDSFGHIDNGSWVESISFHSKKAHRIMIGAEGSGINYYFYKDHNKRVVISQGFDHNPPLDPKTNKPIARNWKLPNESRIIGGIVSSLKIK